MKTLGNIVIILFVVITIYALRGDVLPVLSKVASYASDVLGYSKNSSEKSLLSEEVSIENKNEIAKEQVNTPGPLKVNESSSVAIKSTISIADIIYYTNQERARNGSLRTLTESKTLNKMAGAKASDMLTKQYFEHTSPEGITVGSQAGIYGYEYIILGENLALGNFKDGQSIVDAWMKSPGHRANILNPQYTEIGVGLIQGTYKSQTVWLAVQHFGTPRSICSEVDLKLKAEIDIGQGSIDALKKQIDAKTAEMNKADQYSYEYAGLVSDYNALIRSYNAQIISIKAKVAIYNEQVNSFNSCAKTYRE